MFQGDADNALRYYEDALKIAQETGCRQIEAATLQNVGIIWRGRGDLDKARENLLPALRISVNAGFAQMTEFAVRNLFGVYYLADCEKRGLSREEAEKLLIELGKAAKRDPEKT
jgi:tetratricopeptide (TPR) repeat protein